MELEESIKLAVEGCGVNLYDITQTKEDKENILRIFITSSEGINLDKCAHVSRMLSPLLDIESPINGKYRLEVSSPGIERRLKTLHHFQCSVGSKVKIKKYSTEVNKGEILSVDEDGLIIIKDIDNNTTEIKYDDVLSASTYFDWN